MDKQDKQKEIKNIYLYDLHVLRYVNAEKHSDKYYVLATAANGVGGFIGAHTFYGPYKGSVDLKVVNVPDLSSAYRKLDEKTEKGYRRVSRAEAEDILTRAGIFGYLGVDENIYYFLDDGKGSTEAIYTTRRKAN